MMNNTTTKTLTITINELKLADSLIPLIKSKVTATELKNAGRLKIPVAVVPSVSYIAVPGGALRASGKFIPSVSLKRLTT